MEKRLAEVEINNMQRNTCKYIVARPVDNELWFYASFDDPTQARKCAKEIDGIVTRRIEE